MERDERKKIRPLEVLGRYKYVLLVAALGAALLAWPSEKPPTNAAAAPAAPGAESAGELEQQLEEILGKMAGVGRVDVLLTLHSGRELVLAQDSTLRYSGDVQAPDSYDRTTDTVIVSGGGAGDVVVTQQRFPLYRGALVVCDGGGSDSVRLEIIGAVSALTGLGADKISVVKRGDAERKME